MKKLIFSILLLFLILQVNGQQDVSPKIEQGVLFSSRLDSDDDFDFKVNGFGIEGGYYFLKNWGRRGMISIDLRLAYSQSERSYMNLVEHDDFYTIFFDTIQTRLTGTIKYKNVSLALPIKYRYRLSADGPVFLLIGFNPYVSLFSNSNLKYDLVEYNTVTKMNVSETKNLEDDVRQCTYSQDLMLAGFGYKKDKLMFDVYFSGGSTRLDHGFLGFMDKLSVVCNAYYRLH